MDKDAGRAQEPGMIEVLELIKSTDPYTPADLMDMFNKIITRTNEIVEATNAALRRANVTDRALSVAISRLEQHTHDNLGRAVVSLAQLS